jgi:S-adenosylmethionine decarboxylase
MADSTPFEGPEKLLEIWFTPSPRDLVSDQASATTEEINRCGLRSIPVKYWEEMLDIVRCKILSSIHGAEIDAYLLRYVSDVSL